MGTREQNGGNQESRSNPEVRCQQRLQPAPEKQFFAVDLKGRYGGGQPQAENEIVVMNRRLLLKQAGGRGSGDRQDKQNVPDRSSQNQAATSREKRADRRAAFPKPRDDGARIEWEKHDEVVHGFRKCGGVGLRVRGSAQRSVQP